jgi:hypothetical protein
MALVHAAADGDAPFGGEIGEAHVERDGGKRHDHVAPVELIKQHGRDQRHFNDSRDELKNDHADDGLDGVAAALKHTGEPTGLAIEMKAQRQKVHVLEGEDRQPSHRVHRHLGEHAVAKLRQPRHQDAHEAIGERHRDWRGDRPAKPRFGRDRGAALP